MARPASARPIIPGRAWLWHWLFLVCLVGLLLVLDQASKALVLRNLAVNESWAPIPALGRIFTITHVQNTGIAFGQLDGVGWIFMVVNLAVLVGVIAYYPRLPAGAWSLRVASGLILAGDLGNLIDRVRTGARFVQEGSSLWAALSRASVTDMFDFKIWPVFNVADMCLVAGILTVGWVMWRMESRAQKAAASPADGGPESAADRQGQP